ncbi:COMM domain-containing protein 7-like [Odontomachus brunneus]|uniref:COMM domain-containing protein 7-like n=1 Tax=Odontomachus brunneus TaxID=486640 RepID=UPI0013F1D1A0|nr:COMM domain-containing protein 7-like [Odontomachus brunneus]
MEKNITKIVDVSWRFGVIAASTYSDEETRSYLQLQLYLENNGKIKNVFTEMTIAQFYRFLYDLEKAELDLK